MRNPNPLQDQLLKAGLVSKRKAAQAAREQTSKRKKAKGKGPAAPSAEQLEAQRRREEQTARDRALADERNAQRLRNEARAQARQIIETHKLERDGDHDDDTAYRFTDGRKIRDIRINEALRTQLANGTLVIVRHGDRYELLPRPAADKVRERDPDMIVLDHRRTPTDSDADANADDEYYKQFEVPDDLIW